MTSFSPKMIEKAREAKSAEELLKMARENGIELSPMEAKTYFSQLNPKSGELDDDDLDNVAGGACASNSGEYAHEGDRVRVINGQTCPKCGGTIGYVDSDFTLEVDMVECENKACDRYIATNISLKLGVDIELA
jgi:hypothetical protein